MRAAVELSSLNVEHSTGGPFGAAVFEVSTGKLVSIGMNLVEQHECSVFHAETVALILAQKAKNSFDLSDPPGD